MYQNTVTHERVGISSRTSPCRLRFHKSFLDQPCLRGALVVEAGPLGFHQSDDSFVLTKIGISHFKEIFHTPVKQLSNSQAAEGLMIGATCTSLAHRKPIDSNITGNKSGNTGNRLSAINTI